MSNVHRLICTYCAERPTGHQLRPTYSYLGTAVTLLVSCSLRPRESGAASLQVAQVSPAQPDSVSELPAECRTYNRERDCTNLRRPWNYSAPIPERQDYHKYAKIKVCYYVSVIHNYHLARQGKLDFHSSYFFLMEKKCSVEQWVAQWTLKMEKENTEIFHICTCKSLSISTYISMHASPLPTVLADNK